MAQAGGGDESKERRNVTWSTRAVEQAWPQLLTLPSSPQNSVKLNQSLLQAAADEEEPAKPTLGRQTHKKSQGCFAGCIEGIVTCMLGCCFKPQDADGYIWKLTHTKTDLANLLNWRRRHFFFRDEVRESSLAYISEKEDGALALAAVTCQRGVAAKCTELPKVTFSEQSPEDRRKVVSQLEQHHIAFTDDMRMYTEKEFERQVPTAVHPIKIDWVSEDGLEHTVTLGFVTEFGKTTWLTNFRRTKC